MRVYVNARFITQEITGVQRFAIEVSRYLKQNFHEIKFVAPRDIIHEEIAEELSVERYGIFKGHLWEQINLPFFLWKRDCKLLINLTNNGPFIWKRHILTLHDVGFKVNKFWYSKLFVYFYNISTKILLKSALELITVSQFSKREINKYFNYPFEKIHVVSLDVKQWYFERNNQDIRKKYFVSKPYILSVGTINKRKNYSTLIKVFNELPVENLKLVVVGKINSRVFGNNNFKDLVSKKDSIIFIDEIDYNSLWQLYKNASLFLNLSHYEGYGIPNLEAMAAGCPVIASNIPVFREICKNGALYVDKDDVLAIRNKILELLNSKSLQQDLIENGNKVVTEIKGDKSLAVIKNLINSYR